MVRSLPDENFQYDVCLSFAGEERPFIERVAEILKNKGVRVFFDDYESVELWGKDLYAHLDEVYRHLARYCILFASANYAAKVWPNNERRSAQARALKANREYILPARFDDTPIPGLPDTVHYLDLRRTTPKELAELTIKKIGHIARKDYLPPVPNQLFHRLRIEADKEAQQAALLQAHGFLEVLRRMTAEERLIILKMLRYGCPADLPRNIHIHVDFLRRLTGKPPTRLKRVIGGLNSLGFTCRIRTESEDHKHENPPLGTSEMFEIDWIYLGTAPELSSFPALLVAHEMVAGATEGYCEEHGWSLLERMDFSQLASATATRHSHGLSGRANKPFQSRSGNRPRKGKNRA